MTLAELGQFLLWDSGCATINACADEKSGRQFAFAFELLQPELHTLERFLTIGGIEEHESGGDILQKDGMDLSIDMLACQIPQHGFALGTVFAFQSEFLDGPKLLTVS